jgi:hypothetical protein
MSIQFQGYREDAADNNIQLWNSPSDLTPTGIGAGFYTGTIAIGVDGINIIAVTGSSNVITVSIPSGLATSNPNILIQNSTLATITVSGLNLSDTFNGNATYSIATGNFVNLFAYGSGTAGGGTVWINI